MQTSIQALNKRIATADNLHTIVQIMKALAMAGIRQYETVEEALEIYSQTLELGFQICLRNREKNISKPDAATYAKQILIIFGSDHGMCGSFNSQVISFVRKQIQKEKSFMYLFVVGSRVIARLNFEEINTYANFKMPGSTSGVMEVANSLLISIDELQKNEPIEKIELLYNVPEGNTNYHLRLRQIYPLDAAWLKELSGRKWQSRTLPIFTIKWEDLFSSLARQYFFISLCRAFTDSAISENIARLRSMHSAEQNIEKHLKKLQQRYHQERQKNITEELLDVASGYEAHKKKKMKK